MAAVAYRGRMFVSFLSILALSACPPLTGCGSSMTEMPTANMRISPASATVLSSESVTFNVVGSSSSSVTNCEWTSSNSNALRAVTPGVFVGGVPGNAEIRVNCGVQIATASATVAPQKPAPITITQGGTYTGIWASTDPSIPAVSILTDDPVTLSNSTITGAGTLIFAQGKSKGASLTLNNVTGVGTDPGVAGKQHGAFLHMEGGRSLSVTNCTMREVSFGVLVSHSTLTKLVVAYNQATNMEDRASDGHEGFQDNRPFYGHFIQLSNVQVLQGADISWNQVIDQPGLSSVEDIIDVYDSHGSSNAPIHIHDNYLQGALTAAATGYSGGGIMTEGTSSDLASMTGYVLIDHNVVVQTENYGIAIATGHDVTESQNRVVSCGRDAMGRWLAGPSATAMYMWNISASPRYFNNSIVGNTGGSVRPDAKGNPMVADLWAPSLSPAANNVATGNSFDDPCWVKGSPTAPAEAAEFEGWQKRVSSMGTALGDQHF